MRVSVLLWAQMRRAAGSGRLELELPEGARLDQALDAFYRTNPTLVPHRGSARAAVGDHYADGSRILEDGDVISLIPPVQGG